MAKNGIFRMIHSGIILAFCAKKWNKIKSETIYTLKVSLVLRSKIGYPGLLPNII